MVSITTPRSLLNKLEYDFKQENREKSTVVYSQGVSVGKDGYPDVVKAYQEMMDAMPNKKRTKNVVFACSINPDPREHLSDEQYMLIGKEFMERMGYKDQPFIITRHHDIERDHIHIVSTRVRPDGSKISDKFEGRKARRIIDDLEVKYNLIISPTNRKKQNLKEHQRLSYGMEARPIEVGTENMYEQIQAVIRRVLPNASFQSIGEFNAILKKYNLKAEITKNEYQGKLYDGIAYVPIDSNGKKAGTPITGSELGHGYGLSAVKGRMKRSKQSVESRLPFITNTIKAILKQQPKTIQEMKDSLERFGIRTEVFQNEKGRIYGITFVQDSTNTAVNGSRIGKEFSANVFNDYFAPEIHNIPDYKEYLNNSEEITNDQSFNISGDFGLSTDDGRDYQEEAFGKRMKRLYNKKKSKGHRPKL